MKCRGIMIGFNLCDIITGCSRYTSEWQLKQPNVKEETLTDWLLYQISEELPFVKYFAYTRHEEARTTGADWEWWILRSNNRHLRFRVQAKKVFDQKDNYTGLAHTNKYGLQIDKLLQNAIEHDAIPLYALFHPEGNENSCSLSEVGRDGVFIAGANHLYNDYILSGKMKITSDDLLSKTYPFSCFGCCPLSVDFDKFLHSYYPFEFFDKQSKFPQSNLNLGVHGNFPEYVDDLLGDNPADFGISEKFGFDRLLVYDLREI